MTEKKKRKHRLVVEIALKEPGDISETMASIVISPAEGDVVTAIKDFDRVHRALVAHEFGRVNRAIVEGIEESGAAVREECPA